MEEKNVIIICITVIISVLIISATFFLINSDRDINFINIFDTHSQQNQNIINRDSIDVKSVTFYSDGNPNTGETATINFGKEEAGKMVNVTTLYSRDGSRQNYPSNYETHTIDSEGNIVITDYTPMPKYPDNCVINVNYNGYLKSYECDIGTYKGTQTAIPRQI